jgi:hypothetical protein
LWQWIKGTAWPWLKAHWKLLAKLAGAVVAAVVLGRAVTWLVGVIKGIIVPGLPNHSAGVPFKPLDKRHLAVLTDQGWKMLDVAIMGLTPDKVDSVGLTPGGQAAVVCKHPPLGG